MSDSIETENTNTADASHAIGDDAAAYVGQWELVGAGLERSEVDFVDEEPVPNAVEEWLSGAADNALNIMQATLGLRLSLTDDQAFTELKDGKPDSLWYDTEGVLEESPVPFDGTWFVQGDRVFLKADDTPEDDCEQGDYPVPLRYNAGDAIICDGLRFIDGFLVRTMNVAIDELYLDRISLVYQKT